MLTDALGTFSDSISITASAKSDVIPWGDQLSMANGADGPELVIQVTEDFATLTSLEVQLQTSDTNDGTDLTSADTLLTSGAIPLADLVAGYRFPINSLPTSGLKKYLQLSYVVVGTAATAGKVFAGTVFNSQTNGV